VERSGRRHTLRLFGSFAGGAVAPVLATLGLLLLAMPPGPALHGLIDPWTSILNREVTSLEFYRWVQGTDQLALNLAHMRLWSLRYAGFALPLAALALALRRDQPWRWLVAAGVLALVFASVGPGPYLSFLPGSDAPPGRFEAMRIQEWPHSVRALPAALPLIGIGAFVALLGDRRAGRDPSVGVLRVAVIVFAFALLAKIFFKVRLQHYGFVLAMPGTLVLLVTLIGWIPRSIDHFGGFGPVFRAGSLALALVAGMELVEIVEQRYASRSYTIATGPDRFKVGGKAAYAALVLREIEKRVGPDETLAVIPEGVMLNYLVRRAASTPHHSFMPPELIIYGEHRILDDFRRAPPDYIAVVHKDTTEYGFPFFGQDYGRDLYAWVMSHYSRVRLIGDPPLREGTDFGIDILKRNPR
jgi:hypothetical protein